MDQQAANLLSTLKRPVASSDTKVNLFNALKSDIKHYRVPETAVATIFECIKLAITQQASSTLASSAFSTLGHLVKRLKIQDASGTAIVQLAPRLFPALHERLGDLREPVRTSASQALSDLYPFCSSDVEQIIRDEAIGGSNARAKEVGMRWVVKMHKEEGMPFKSYVAAIVAHLEDADGTVREAAKTVLIELFQDAPDRAKLDLKKQLKAHSVRHMIESQILEKIGSTSSAHAPPPADHSTEPEPARASRARPIVDHSAQFASSINSEAAQPPPQETVAMDPIYVHAQRELEDIFRDMLPHFEGKEDEHNWMPRDKSILKVRRLLKGNAPNEYHHAFMAGVKSLVDGIIKASNSLRTTMSSNGCQLVQELAKTLGPALDPHVEIFLQSFIKMSAATKHIAAENGKQTSDAIFQNCTYHVRMVQHIWFAAQEKNVQQRQCVPEWLRTILKRQSSYKQHFESSGGLDLAEKCIKKGLDDANPKVKEGMRATYWTFAKGWPDKADAIMSKLDPKSRTALERDPNNPNALLHGGATLAPPTARPGGASSRSTLREVMAEQRRAKAAAGVKVPDRPNSAMELSPSKSRSHANLRTAARGPSNLSSTSRSDGRHAPSAPHADAPGSTTAKKGSSLMSGPVRRPRRAEIQRPQTADPYASRRLLRPETPASNASPLGSPQRGTGSKASPSAIPTTSSAAKNKTRLGDAPASGSPRSSVVKRSPMHVSASSPRPSSKGSTSQRVEDEFTLVPSPKPSAVTRGREVASPGHQRGGHSGTMSVDNGILAMTEDEGFTLVLPQSHTEHSRQRSPLPVRSPLKAMFDDARERTGKLSPEAQRAVAASSREQYDAASNGVKHDEVQIYEDPFTGGASQRNGTEERRVLGELPVNENIRLATPTQSPASHHSPTDSPQQDLNLRSPLAAVSAAGSSHDEGEVLRNRRLLASGIQRIRSKTLDAHGFRRVQDLAKSKLDIWDDGRRFDELMAVLLEYLQTFESEPRLAGLPGSKAAGLKAQALGAVRALLTVHRKPAASWHARALLMLLVCRKNLPADQSASYSHVITDLQRTAEDIVAAGNPATCIDALVDFLADESSSSTAAPRAIAMALDLLRQFLNRDHLDLTSPRRIACARAAARYLADPDAEVRKVDVDLASDLFDRFNSLGPASKDAFWREFQGVEEGRLGLLTYYIAKKSRANAAAASTAAAGTV